MTCGCLSIVGVGPGDPELVTLKAVRKLREADSVYVPVSHLSRETWLSDVVKLHAAAQAKVAEVSFSAARERSERALHWQQTAAEIIGELQQGKDVAFVTLGDPQLYSTSLYLLRAVNDLWPQAPVDIVPGISAMNHCAALTAFTLGEGTEPVTIMPSVTALEDVRRALTMGGTLVLMKIGRHLPTVIDLLEEEGLLEQSVFVARAGLPDQLIVTDMRTLRDVPAEKGNLAIILIHTEGSL